MNAPSLRKNVTGTGGSIANAERTEPVSIAPLVRTEMVAVRAGTLEAPFNGKTDVTMNGAVVKDELYGAASVSPCFEWSVVDTFTVYTVPPKNPLRGRNVIVGELSRREYTIGRTGLTVTADRTVVVSTKSVQTMETELFNEMPSTPSPGIEFDT